MGPVACPETASGGWQLDPPSGCTVSRNSLDSVSVKAQPKNNRDTNAKRSGFQSGGSPCRRLKKAIREIRNRRQTKPRLRPMCRPTRRRKARASRPAARSRKRPDARFGLEQTDQARLSAGCIVSGQHSRLEWLQVPRSSSIRHRGSYSLQAAARTYSSTYSPLKCGTSISVMWALAPVAVPARAPEVPAR